MVKGKIRVTCKFRVCSKTQASQTENIPHKIAPKSTSGESFYEILHTVKPKTTHRSAAQRKTRLSVSQTPGELEDKFHNACATEKITEK